MLIHRVKSFLLKYLNDWLNFLTTSGAIRKQILFYLYMNRIDKAVQISYDKRFNQVKKSNNNDFYRVVSFPQTGQTFRRRYELFGNVIMCWTLIKNAFPQQLKWTLLFLFDFDNDGKLFGLDPACSIPGRFIMHEVIRNEFACFIAFANLCLRWTFHYLERPFSFSLIDFVMQDDKAIEMYYDLYHEASICCKKKDIRMFNRALEYHPFSQFMCYKVDDHDSRLQYRLKANREHKFYNKSRRQIGFTTIIASAIFIYLALVVGGALISFALSDFGYLYSYKGCDLELQHEYETNTEHRWFWFTATPHRFIMLFMDVIENAIIWLDSGVSITYLFALPYLLNEDLTLQWKLMHKKIEHACDRLRHMWYRDQERLMSSYRFGMYVSLGTGFRLANLRQPSSTTALRRGCLSSLEQQQQQQQARSNRIVVSKDDLMLHEIRWELRDFFKQVSLVDLLIGDIITLGFAFWLSALLFICNSAIRYYLKHPGFLKDTIGISFPTLMAYGLPISAIPTTYICSLVFKIYSNSLITYRELCSIVAYNQASDVARVQFFEEVTEYYIHKKQNCFKLLHMYPFKATSYMSLVGWTVSSLAVVTSLANRFS